MKRKKILFIYTKHIDILLNTRFAKSNQFLFNYRLLKQRKGSRLSVFSKTRSFLLSNQRCMWDLISRRFNLLHLTYFLYLKRYFTFFERFYILNSYLRSFLLIDFYFEDFFFFKRTTFLTTSSSEEFKNLQKILWESRFFFLTSLSKKLSVKNYSSLNITFFDYNFLYSQWLNINFFLSVAHLNESATFKTFFFFKFYYGFLVLAALKTKCIDLFFLDQFRIIFYYYCIYNLCLLDTIANYKLCKVISC